MPYSNQYSIQLLSLAKIFCEHRKLSPKKRNTSQIQTVRQKNKSFVTKIFRKTL